MENGVHLSNIAYDAEIAGYVLNPTVKSTMQNLASEYLNIDVNELIENNANNQNIQNDNDSENYDGKKQENTQINLFDTI